MVRRWLELRKRNLKLTRNNNYIIMKGGLCMDLTMGQLKHFAEKGRIYSSDDRVYLQSDSDGKAFIYLDKIKAESKGGETVVSFIKAD